MQLRRFYIAPENFSPSIKLDLEQSRHLKKVLRLRVGDQISVFDGAGNESIFLVGDTKSKEVEATFVKKTVPLEAESQLKIELAVPLLKKSNTELVLQKAVELGITRFIPIITARCEIRPEAWKSERAFKIAVEAAKQSGRATLPEVCDPIEFGDFVSAFDTNGFLFYEEPDGESLPAGLNSDRVQLVTGPEGGWEPAEIEMAKLAGFRIVHFGGRILKAETAAITATAIFQNRFGDLN